VLPHHGTVGINMVPSTIHKYSLYWLVGIVMGKSIAQAAATVSRLKNQIHCNTGGLKYPFLRKLEEHIFPTNSRERQTKEYVVSESEASKILSMLPGNNAELFRWYMTKRNFISDNGASGGAVFFLCVAEVALHAAADPRWYKHDAKSGLHN
jgi:hypothetical protein